MKTVPTLFVVLLAAAATHGFAGVGGGLGVGIPPTLGAGFPRFGFGIGRLPFFGRSPFFGGGFGGFGGFRGGYPGLFGRLRGPPFFPAQGGLLGGPFIGGNPLLSLLIARLNTRTTM